MAWIHRTKLLFPKIRPVPFNSIHFSWDRESADPIHPHSVLPSAEWMCSLADLEKQGQIYRVTMDGYGQVIITHFFSIPKLENLMAPIVQEYVMAEAGYAFMMRGSFICCLWRLYADLCLTESWFRSRARKLQWY